MLFFKNSVFEKILSVILLLVFVESENVAPGVNLLLIPCGLYPEYQQFSLINKQNNTYQIALTKYSDSCIDCNGCNAGYTSEINNCKNSSVDQIFSINELSNTYISSLKYSTATCLSFDSSLSWSYAKTKNCFGTLQYGQNFSYSTNDNYIRSYFNSSLCITSHSFNINCSILPYKSYDYCNETLPNTIRTNDLVNRMNLYEKISILGSNIGLPQFGFPPVTHGEALHGVEVNCGAKTYYNPDGNGCPTSFPHALLLGATFNRTLWKYISIGISDEARALNNQGYAALAFYTPNINLCRDPRWGRCQEVPGEDPYLTSQYAMEYSRNFQYGIDNKYLKCVSTAKHYADYDQEGNYGTNRNDFNAIVTDEDQVEYYWPAFRSVVQTANVQSCMCSYNGVNGIPSCGNDYFMNEIMRNEWGFNGFFASDCGAITDPFFNEYASKYLNNSKYSQISFAIESGCDTECGNSYIQYGPVAYSDGILKEDVLNTAVYRMLLSRFNLGVMDSNVYYTTYGPEYIDNEHNRQLALNAAEQGIILLKNNYNILPLKSDYSQTIAMIGPHANSTQEMLSIYVGENHLVNKYSPWQVISRLVGNKAKYSLGCNVTCLNISGFNDAINLANNSDIAIVFLGLYPGHNSNDPNISIAREDETWDRNTFEFPGNQLELLKQISNVNKNTILVLMNGCTLDLSWPKSSDNVKGIIKAFYPGELGGEAIANILYGKISPAAKLPYTIYPQSMIYNRNISDMNLRNNGGITYRYYTGTPVYPFGYGLTYTNFTYIYYPSNETIYFNTKTLADYYRNGKYFYRNAVSYKIQVTNVGKMDSDCIVLGFIYSNNTDSPIKKLFDFDRVFVPKGESMNVTLSVSAETVSLTNKYGNERVVPGKYKLTIGDHMNFITTKLVLYGKEESIFNLPQIKENYYEKLKMKFTK